MIIPLDLETLMKVIPRRRFVGMHNRSLHDAARMNDETGFPN